MINFTEEFLKSWMNRIGNVNSMDDIDKWVASINKTLKVNVEKVDFSYDGFWHYDEKDGFIRNDNDSFFQIAGYQEIEDDQIIREQPIIIQNEIGYLGILCKMIDGTLNFLMQAKIEPGNVNVVQISPTLQATKSNYTRRHGGKSPNYLDYFADATGNEVVVDQIQSEQASRFYKKRNRNVIIYTESDIPVYDNYMWMTLGQIKKLMKKDNLVNMDTRTVISCIPFCKDEYDYSTIKNENTLRNCSITASLFKSVDYDAVHKVFNVLNDHKMYQREKSRLLPLKSLKGWELKKDEIICRTPYDFKVVYCRIEIENREVKYWEQPLIESIGMATFGLLSHDFNGIIKYLVCAKHEMGCFDSAELGPTVQTYPSGITEGDASIEKLFFDTIQDKKNIIKDVVLSEEGGRFYHEQNRNMIVNLDNVDDIAFPRGYFWLDLATLVYLIQFNNCANIQLRNLLSLIDF